MQRILVLSGAEVEREIQARMDVGWRVVSIHSRGETIDQQEWYVHSWLVIIERGDETT